MIASNPAYYDFLYLNLSKEDSTIPLLLILPQCSTRVLFPIPFIINIGCMTS